MSWFAVGAAVVTTGAGIYGQKKSASDARKAQRNAKGDIGADINAYLKAYSDALPQLVKDEGKYRKQFQGLNLNEISSFLNGKNGLFAQSGAATDAAGNILNSARLSDLQGQKGAVGATRGLLQQLSPEGRKQVDAAQKQAQAAQLAAQGLTPQERRSAEQSAREGFAARGRVDDNASIFSEALNRDSILASKRQEASQATERAYGMAQSFYTQPGLNLLNQTPQSYQAGQGLLGIGLSSIGSATPQLLNPDAGVNIGAVNRQNQLGAASAAAQTAAYGRASTMNNLGNIFTSYLQYGS